MEDAEKRKISKLRLAMETDQENDNKDFLTISSVAKDREGLISYMYLKFLLPYFG